MQKKIPVTTYVLGALGLGFLVRGLWNAHRQLTDEAGIAACPGQEGAICEQTIELTTAKGADVYSVGSGTVLAAGPDFVHAAVDNEPVVLFYDGMATTVKPGSSLWRGQPVGTSPGRFRFGVWAIKPDGSLSPLEPASWLASRGYKVAGSLDAKSEALWCGKGRQLSIPKTVHGTCKLGMPQAASFALLPVSISQE